MTDQLDHSLAALDHAEARLSERARQRYEAREQRERRRAFRRSLLASPGREAVLALTGSTLLVAALSLSGGDLSTWPYGLALITVAAAFIAPAAIAGRIVREGGTLEVAIAVITTFGLELVLTFIVAFLLLGLGPA